MQLCDCDQRQEPAVLSHYFLSNEQILNGYCCVVIKKKTIKKQKHCVSAESHDLWVVSDTCILISLNRLAYTHVYTIPSPRNKRCTCSHPSVGLCAAPSLLLLPSSPDLTSHTSPITPTPKTSNNVLNVPVLRGKKP